MIPKKYDAHGYDYPDFQADQILSADHLNHAFSFNEQQERLTRTNLIGIGIVCGLKATKSSDGKTVTITKGTGVTSHGYLIVHGKENSDEAIDYKQYRDFKPFVVQHKQYDVFVTAGVAKYPIWELLDSTEAETTDPQLTQAFISSKVLLLFYEMLEVDAKNCDTTSCDDKGKTVTITIRKLLVNKTDADQIILELNTKAKTSGSGEVFPGITSLPELKLPRFDVLATGLETTSDIYNAYQKIFTKTFVESVGNALNSTYNIFKTYLKDNSNPFSNFNSTFAFLHNGTIDGNDLIHFQYYWDFFCDLIAAYNEWRLTAQPLGAMCTPPEALFPRHLFLWNFAETEGVEKSKYRNYFIPSPIHSQHENKYKEFKSLFQRLVSILINRKMPVPEVSGTAKSDSNIRITPSLIGSQPLGSRAIPYYYKANEASALLIDVWNYEATKRGKQNQILSYNPSYNNSDDFVKNPLKYDLEPYNFLRVEGHIGKTYENVLANLKKLINDNRLPVDVVALELSDDPSNTSINDVCAISNIQLEYELLRNEMRCCLKKNITFWGQLVIKDNPKVPGGVISASDSIIITHATENDEPIKANKKTTDLKDTLKKVESNFKFADSETQKKVSSMMTYINTAAANSTSDSPKVRIIKESIHNIVEGSIAGKYLDFQKNGDILIAKLPVPDKVFNAETLSYYAMVIIDEMEELLLLLNAANVLEFDLEEFGLHAEALKNSYKTLLELLTDYLNSQKAVATIKASVSQSFHAQADAIAATIPEILEKNTTTIILLLSNQVQSTSIKILTDKLKIAKTNIAKQKLIDDEYQKLDKDGMMIPEIKTGAYVEDSILRDILNHLKNPACLCGYESFKSLQEFLKKEIEALKQYNLFSKFVKKHPGIQHKAGVSMGGTFIIAYHRKGTPAIPAYEKEIKTFKDGIVVADFYLPYLCNSDCQPIQFTITIPPQAITFGLEILEYCNDDINSYIFNTNPTGGTVTSPQQDSVKSNENGTFSFLPEKVIIPAGAKEVVVPYTYSLGDQMQLIQVKVYMHPVVKIIDQLDENNPSIVHFTLDKPDLVTEASWDFGDGKTSSVISPSHTYSTAGTYTVSCIVRNGPCSFTPDNGLVSTRDPEPVVIDLKISEVCIDAPVINFTVKPKGGTFTGEGFTESPAGSGKFKFTPSAVGLNGASKKTVSFTYIPLAGNPQSIQITVFEKPHANQEIRVVHGKSTDAEFHFFDLKNVSIIEIDYNDGTPVGLYNVTGLNSFTSPKHLFPGPGPFTIKSKLINGVCTTVMKEVEIRFEVKEEPEKLCQPFSIPVDNYIELQPQLAQSDAFLELYTGKRLEEVSEFFKELQKQLKKNPNVPLSYFAQRPLKPEWIRTLPVEDIKARDLSLKLMNIFTDVTNSISCLKNEDIDRGSISTGMIMDTIVTKIGDFGKLSATEKKTIAPLVTNVKGELKRLETNKEINIKNTWGGALENIIRTIKAGSK